MKRFTTLMIMLALLLTLSNISSAQGTWTNFKNPNIYYGIAVQGDYVWSGTPEGLMKLDTRDMTHEIITIEDTRLYTGVGAGSIAISHDGDIWTSTVVTGYGISRYDGESWTEFTQDVMHPSHRLTQATAYSIAFGPDGVVWAATGGVICRYDGDSWTEFTGEDGLPDFDYVTIAVDSDGVLWAVLIWIIDEESGKFGSTLVGYDGIVWTTHTDDILNDVVLVSLDIDSAGVKWVGTSENGVISYDGNDWKIFTTDDGLANNNMNLTAIGPENDVWAVSTWVEVEWVEADEDSVYFLKRALSMYDGEKWEVFSAADESLPGSPVHDMTVGPDGVVWISAVNCLFRFDGEKWTTFTTEGGPGYGVSPMVFIDRDGVLWAGTSSEGIYRYDGNTWKIFTTDDGLASNYVNTIAFAPDGTVWAATDDGISRFNGTTWESFVCDEDTLLNNVTCLAIDSDGVAWCGTPVGLLSFDGTTWKTYEEEKILSEKPVSAVAVGPDGIVWAGTIYLEEVEGRNLRYMTIMRYDGETWVRTETSQFLGVSPSIMTIVFDPDGEPWAGFASGILRYDGESWKTEVFNTGYGNSIAFGTDGLIWSTSDEGVTYYDGERWREYTDNDGLADNNVSSIAITPDGKIWAGTALGLSRFEPQPESSNLWAKHTIGFGKLPQKVGMLTPAPDGVVWALVNKDGAFRYDGETWTGYNTENGLPSIDIYATSLGPDGAVWIATKLGIATFDGENWTTYTTADGLPNNRTTSLAIGPDGVVWAGIYRGGVCRFDGKTWKAYTEDDGMVYGDNGVELVALGLDGAVWTGSRSGVSRFDGTTWVSYTEDDGVVIGRSKVYFLTAGPDGSVWFGTSRNGLYRYDGATWTNVDISLGVNSVTAKGSITFAPDGALWVATTSGVNKFDGETWTVYTEKDGLAPGGVVSIAFEPDGTAWLAATGGVTRFDGKTWGVFTEHNGLYSRDVHSIAVGTDGKVWCGEKGVVSLLKGLGGVGVESMESLPSEFVIRGNFPNPFNLSTTICFAIPRETVVNLVIYNIMGQKIRTLVTDRRAAGLHYVRWDGRDDSGTAVSSGIYFTYLTAGKKAVSNRMMLLK